MDGEPAARPVLTVEGGRVALGPLRRALVPTYQRWHNDIATTRTYALAQPSTLEQEDALFARLTADPRSVFFTIYERVGWQPVGTTYLTRIDHRNRSAEFGILIGDPAERGKGFGSEVTRLVLGYAFGALGLHTVMLTVYACNLAGRRAYEKAGFREFARLRERHHMGGRWWDEVWMDCLATEFSGLATRPDAAQG